jgi:amino acid transporter
MRAIATILRGLPLLKFFGAFLIWAGLSFAVAGVSIAASERFIERDRVRLAQELDGMKSKLVAAKVAENQMEGLLRVYRSAVVQQLTQQHLMIVASLVLFSLLVASFGFSLTLLGKLKALSYGEKTPTGGPSTV